MIMAEKALRGVADLGLTKEAKARFLGGNASRVYGLDTIPLART